jgi:hypothetical protein
MINLRAKGTGKPLGQISDEQLQYLVDNLEEEWLEDKDYALTQTVVTYFEQHGADPALVALLRDALGGKTETEIVWSRTA